MLAVWCLPEWVLVTARALMLADAKSKEGKVLLQVPDADGGQWCGAQMSRGHLTVWSVMFAVLPELSWA